MAYAESSASAQGTPNPVEIRYPAKHPSASTARATRRDQRPRYGTMSAPVQVQAVAPPFAVVVDVLDPLRLPRRKFEVVRDHARALLELLLEHGAHFVIGHRKQVHGK